MWLMHKKAVCIKKQEMTKGSFPVFGYGSAVLAHRSEVKRMSITEYDEEKTMAM